MLRPFTRLAVTVLALSVGALAASACHSLVPPNGPASTCEHACQERVRNVCSGAECARGCELVLDRVIEHETDTVLACMARSTRGCADVVWAECAARVGPRVDGGPPAPVTETFPDED